VRLVSAFFLESVLSVRFLTVPLPLFVMGSNFASARSYLILTETFAPLFHPLDAVAYVSG